MSDLIVSASPHQDLGEDFLARLTEKVEADEAEKIKAPSEGYLHLAVTKRDGNGGYVGGLYGYGLYNWLNIDLLYVEPKLRNHGIGSEFVRAAEQEIRQRNYAGIIVYTITPDAVPFYQKHGFVVAMEMPNRPTGKTTYVLKKLLDNDQSLS